MSLVFITGASSGLGQAMALHYYQQGWALALVARRGRELAGWAEAQGLDPARWRVYPADVSDVAAITAAGRQCIAEQGLPDVVIANAGISIGMDSAIAEDLAVLQRIYATNNIGLAATFQPFVAAMNARGSGRLVGVASVAGIRGLPGHAGYCSSKAAVISYCESLRGECRPYGVRVVTIAPGYIATPLTAKNRYRMPFLMQPADFAARAYAAIEAGASLRFIPWQMGVVARLMRLLPNVLFDRLLAGRPRKHRQGE
ncbi:SDR family oxidoreductase [Paucibacter soli]|uniref:SDR family oxidoreductase n=1 Tax=Paucibacter soli TaxID=3133433 RepID=UPI00309EFDF3